MPKRYEIHFADLNPTLGSEISKIRPVVIISDDAMNTYLETVVVCPITSKIHPTWRTRLQITCVDKQAEVAVDRHNWGQTPFVDPWYFQACFKLRAKPVKNIIIGRYKGGCQMLMPFAFWVISINH
jgi:hypothetical protein